MKKIIFPNSDQKREIDILVKKDGDIIVIECKATRSPLDLNFTEKWINSNIPIIRRWVAENYPSSVNNIRFELWSIGGYAESAESLLAETAQKTRKYTLQYFDRSNIVEKVRRSGVQIVADILKQHYSDKTYNI